MIGRHVGKFFIAKDPADIVAGSPDFPDFAG
jgi:hypothetical protein